MAKKITIPGNSPFRKGMYAVNMVWPKSRELGDIPLYMHTLRWKKYLN